MSDPVSNAEIEDVLSSIRRLVSVDQRGDQRDHDAARPEAEPPQDQDLPENVETSSASEEAAPADDARLVLTPSFRVEPEEEEIAEEAFDEGAEDSSEYLTLGQWQIPEELRDGDEAGQLSEPDWDEDAGDDVAVQHTTDVHVDEDAPAVEADRSGEEDVQLKEWLMSDVEQEASSEANWHAEDEDGSSKGYSPETNEDMDAASDDDIDPAFEYEDLREAEEVYELEPVTSELEARIAEVEAAVAARDDQWEPDGASEDDYAGGRTEPLPWEDHAEPATPMFISRVAQKEASEDAADVGPGEMESDGSVADASDQPESQAEPDDGKAATAGEDDAYAASIAEDAERFNSDTAAETQSKDDSWYREDADAVLDEEALRDLVSEIVRQELQGTLGERITRNVRKLVRREIHRAMMGQDLD